MHVIRKQNVALKQVFILLNLIILEKRGLMNIRMGWCVSIFLKKQSFNDVTDEDIEKIEFLLNNGPWKVLNFWTLLEVFNEFSKKNVIVALQN